MISIDFAKQIEDKSFDFSRVCEIDEWAKKMDRNGFFIEKNRGQLGMSKGKS